MSSPRVFSGVRVTQSLVLYLFLPEVYGTTLRRVWRVWRFQRGNKNPYIEEEQTTQWPKEKVQKDKQRRQPSVQ
jgi:hypothetical protein